MSGVDVRSLKLKFGWDHFRIVTQGLDFGLDELTPDELAECLNEICPCGRKKHSAEYLKKVRSLIRRVATSRSKKIITKNHDNTVQHNRIKEGFIQGIIGGWQNSEVLRS
jgi:hypothetical protein